MWRVATAWDDQAIASMCMALYAEDPGPAPVPPERMRETLRRLRTEAHRGRAVVCDIDGHVVGYALLISFWSNEPGGEICVVNELFIAPFYRSRGLATMLFERLAGGEPLLWSSKPAALALEVTPQNGRARAFYERLGFSGENLAMRKLAK
jgi:GNAT superfamily N-acetyltransferase